jgi:small-conductance mechanosensitive channel
MPELTSFFQTIHWGDIVASGLIIVAVLTVRWFVIRAIRKNSETLTADQRKWISTTQNGAMVLIIVGLLIVWALELSQVALSLAAFSVAIVIGSKELIMCLTGGLYRTATNPFEVGDWIEVGPFRGEVLVEGLMTTKLQELANDDDHMHTYTGRDMTMPNALLLLHPVIDLNFSKRYVFQRFGITAHEKDVDPDGDLATLQQLVEDEWANFDDKAEDYIKSVRRRSGIDFKRSAPHVTVSTTELNAVRFNVTLFCPRENASATQSRIITAMLSMWHARRSAAAKEAAAS